MRVAISIEHPAWAYQFRRIIEKNNLDGETLVLAVNKDMDLALLDSFGIAYRKLADSTGRSVMEKGLLFVRLCLAYSRAVKVFQPDILIGRASPMMAVAARVCRKPHVIFEDTEVSKISLNVCRKLSTWIITPQSFHRNLGRKQIRMPIYKELFYLHEKEFTPDPGIPAKSGIDISVPYVVVRFISWNASHDFGIGGIPDDKKIAFIQRLAGLCRVYISSEEELPTQLKQYTLKSAYEDIHHVLYYALAVISEGASMASEAAILGTHAFYLNKIASGTTEEQEEKYHLLTVLHDPRTRYDAALQGTENLLRNPNTWREGKEKRRKIMENMPNPNAVFWEKMKEEVEKHGMER